MKDKLVCFHLYNDFSGSPKVLRDILEGLSGKGCQIDIVSSRGGVLDSVGHPSISRRSYSYRFSANPAVTMLRYVKTQALTFAMALRYAMSGKPTFYINTILPLGPALAGKLTGRKVIYHYHENAFAKGLFYRFLARCMQMLADRIICVSAYQASFLSRKSGVEVVPNSLSDSFVSRLRPDIPGAFLRKKVLMLSSLKEYKGTARFISIASRLPEFRFELVINDDMENIDRWIASGGFAIPDNLVVLPRTDDVASRYNSASLVLNLSNPRLFIETFGLTALEAMSCGLPVIVPEVGGIAEMVTDGFNGYRIDCSKEDEIAAAITRILTDNDLYHTLAANALAFSGGFDIKTTVDKIKTIIEEA